MWQELIYSRNSCFVMGKQEFSINLEADDKMYAFNMIDIARCRIC